ncbi:MAG TPA: DUF4351 domain-containing protein [Blastocatellia bacterium]|nr:DUF4351 domain-containing protein [Blastocatellia bacterium]HMX25573.1 DUF4351 domain-containing protein [Blastocatellia bacterium]HMZ20343.1 DUF4351 domain-containing protein [Blastocatellia bacterium]HNG32851.1 DUF4351 domain-containing protein [Blastocatellia bacterium]
MQKIMADAAIGRRLADKLAKVYLLNGEELWVLVHLEVQGQRQKLFERRMYVYSYRAFDRFGRMVASFAILTDENCNWRPNEFGYKLLGTEMSLKFQTVKLLDFAADWESLERSTNPFAVVVMAFLKAIETRRSPERRYAWKMGLMKGLYRRGYGAEDVRQLFRFIDWVLTLPKELKTRFKDELNAYEEEQRMQYITSFEELGIEKGIRIGIEKGIERGIEKGIEKGIERGQREAAVALTRRQLERKLNSLSARAVKRVEALPLDKLEQLAVDLLDFTSTKDLTAWLGKHATPGKAKRKAKSESV